jgi:hypothetical protein
MPWFAVHTEEIVHGVYNVEAKDEQDAKDKFENASRDVGEQTLYEAWSVQVDHVEALA